MTGSGEAASKMLKDINTLAVTTPFRIGELRTGAKQLKAFGFDNEQVVPTLKMLGDVSAGTGTSMERIILAYGQVRSMGRLMGPELRQFTDAGIPIIDALAKVMERPSIAIKSMVTEGLVSFPKVEQAFLSMTQKGGQFFNLMIEQSMTVSGKFSNMQDYIELALTKIGQSFLKGFGVSDLLDQINEAIQGVGNMESMPGLERFFGRVRVVFDSIVGGIQDMVSGITASGVEKWLDRIRQLLDIVVAGFQAAATVIGNDLATAMGGLSKMNWTDWKEIAIMAVKGVGQAFMGLTDILGKMAKMLGESIEGFGRFAAITGMVKGTPDRQELTKAATGYKGLSATDAARVVGKASVEYGQDTPQYGVFARELYRKATGKEYNPFQEIGQSLQKLDKPLGDLGQRSIQFADEMDRLLRGGSGPVSRGLNTVVGRQQSEEKREANRLAAEKAVTDKIQAMNDQFALTRTPEGLKAAAIELGGKTLGDYMAGKGGPLGVFQSQMERFRELSNFRDPKTGFGFMGPETDNVINFGRVAAFRQMQAAMGAENQKQLGGFGIGTSGEAEIIGRSRLGGGQNMLQDVRDTLRRAEELQRQQLEYDRVIAEELTRRERAGDPTVVGGRI